MYDSRSSHPRNGLHKIRAWRKEDYERLPVRPRLSEREAIQDQIESFAEVGEFPPGLKHYRASHAFICRHGFEPWRARIIGCLCREREFYWRPIGKATQEEESFDWTERLADWELELLDLPAGCVWTTNGDHVWHATDDDDDVPWPDEEPEVEYEPESADAPDTHWLDADPRDFFQALGDAWVVEGPSLPEPSVKAAGYVRAYDLAREVGIDAKHLVEYLRLEGEYIASHTSYVANPIAEIVHRQAEGLRAKYGERKQRRGDTLALLIAEERARLTRPPRGAFARPGAPHPFNQSMPVNNPFKTRSNA